ncbi:pyridoxal phosphate-dependent class II aminotransferase [Novosphingobium sp. G106]|uniref:threonine-phosphate decarboxylase n=1 Tax=Novosphingobium sp. G106 TaxID=2849500 RepID=UPI001C2DBC67|nr:threonine-phosphate decarboxylase [Novosphingobium sp. G106]MBV1687452.1 pyridoxal phosphate-dependent class II aminotransferase [Novosphingobium sp. G106]
MSEWTYHGGRLSEAKARFGESGEPWLDLSTGINPHAWPGASAMSIDWQALPDVQALADLECAAADYFGVDSAYVCAVPGTEIGLRLLGDMLPGAAAHVVPSYRTHAEMFGQSRPVSINEFAGCSEATLLLANPNNPDGRITPRANLLTPLDRLQEGARWLVIDEAFADVLPEASLADHIDDTRQLIIMRSFGKFFGLAGLRLGFVLGPRKIIGQFRERLGSWPVSSAALAIGRAAYRDNEWIGGMRSRLRDEAAALDIMLKGHGLMPIGDCPLFRLIETDNGGALFERLARRSILTRPFADNPRWLRLGLPADERGLVRLDRALALG